MQIYRSLPATIVFIALVGLIAIVPQLPLTTASVSTCEGFSGCAQVSNPSIVGSPKPTPTPTPIPDVIDGSPQPELETGPELEVRKIAEMALGGKDADCDCVEAGKDNCPFTYNPDQKDSDNN